MVRITLERIAGRDVVVVACPSDPRSCLIFTPRDPEFPALYARATAKQEQPA